MAALFMLQVSCDKPAQDSVKDSVPAEVHEKDDEKVIEKVPEKVPEKVYETNGRKLITFSIRKNRLA